MANFVDGFSAGFTAIEAIRDRRAARELQAREMGLREMANQRAETAFQIGLEDHAHARDVEDRQFRASQARARVLGDPDNANADDLTILQQAGDADTLARLDEYRGKTAFATTSLRDLAGRAAQAPSGAVAAQAQDPYGRAPQPPAPGEQSFLAGGDMALPPDQFGDATANRGGFEESFNLPSASSRRAVPFGEVQEWLSPDDAEALTGERRRKGVSAPGMRFATVQVPPGVLTKREILALPATEQSAAIEKNKELLGSRRQWADTFTAKAMEQAQAGRKGFQERYESLLDPGKPSDLRDMAARSPTQFVSEYFRDRNSLEPNTRAQVDKWSGDAIIQSLVNLQLDSKKVPMTKDGTPDFASPEAKTLKTNMEQAIALSRAISKDFTVQDAAGIRGGLMPRGNAALTGRVVDAIASQPMPARPLSANEDRMMRTQLGRLAASDTDGKGARNIKGPQIEAIGKAVGRGWITLEQAENLLLTGKMDPKTLSVVTRDPKDDLVINGVIVDRGHDPAKAEYARGQLPNDAVSFIDAQFKGLYPGDKPEQQELRSRRMGQFLTSLATNRERLAAERGFDPLANPTQPQLAAMVLAFTATDQAKDAYTSGITGAVRNWLYPFDEQGAPYSDEILSLARDFLPDDYGVVQLDKAKIDLKSVRNRLITSNSAEARSLAYTLDDNQLLDLMKQQAAKAGQ